MSWRKSLAFRMATLMIAASKRFKITRLIIELVFIPVMDDPSWRDWTNFSPINLSM